MFLSMLLYYLFFGGFASLLIFGLYKDVKTKNVNLVVALIMATTILGVMGWFNRLVSLPSNDIITTEKVKSITLSEDRLTLVTEKGTEFEFFSIKESNGKSKCKAVVVRHYYNLYGEKVGVGVDKYLY